MGSYNSMVQNSTAMSLLASVLVPATDDVAGSGVGKFVRLALATAMLSVCFESGLELLRDRDSASVLQILTFVGLLASFPLVLFVSSSRLGIIIFSLFQASYVFQDWHGTANHAWLAFWTIPAAAVVSRWWEQAAYADYLRITLGVVMLAAAGQKILAGTYFDGSYIAFLSYSGSTTEQMFWFLCSQDTLQSPCGWHKFIGSFIVIWQVAVGLLLLAGLRSLWFLFIEVSFLIGAGLFADEMNFQVLNIALLCIAFRVGMSYSLFAICGFLLVIDAFLIARLLSYVV